MLADAAAIELAPTTSRLVTVRVRAIPAGVHGVQQIKFVLVAPEGEDDVLVVREASRFLVP